MTPAPARHALHMSTRPDHRAVFPWRASTKGQLRPRAHRQINHVAGQHLVIWAADFSSGGTRGSRGAPAAKPTRFRLYLTGLGLATVRGGVLPTQPLATFTTRR